MPTFNAYIDGFNFYKGVLEKRPHLKWLNLKSFCQSLVPDFNLGEVFYFTARIKERYQGDEAPRRQHLYLRALEASGVKIVCGRTVKNRERIRVATTKRKEILVPELPSNLGLTQFALSKIANSVKPDLPKAQVSYFSEKGTDVNLASYMLRDAFKNNVKSFLLISGDTDLLTPVRFLKEMSALIQVAVPHHGQQISAFKECATRVGIIDIGKLDGHLFPHRYVSPKGRQIHCPPQWR